MVYINKDTKYKAIIVKKFQGVIYLKYISGPYEGTTFPIFDNIFEMYWIKY